MLVPVNALDEDWGGRAGEVISGPIFCDRGWVWGCGLAVEDEDSNELSRSSSAGNRCSTERSTLGALDGACRTGEGDGRQDVNTAGAGDGACDDNRGDGEGRGEFEAEVCDVPLPGTAKLEEDSTPVAPTLAPVLAFCTSPRVGAGARSDRRPSPSKASFGLFGARKRLVVSGGLTLNCGVGQEVPDVEVEDLTVADGNSSPPPNESPKPLRSAWEPRTVLRRSRFLAFSASVPEPRATFQASS